MYSQDVEMIDDDCKTLSSYQNGNGKRRRINDDDNEYVDINHVFENKTFGQEKLKPYSSEYSQHKFKYNIRKDIKSSYEKLSLEDANKRKKEIQKEEIRQIMKQNKFEKKIASQREIEINNCAKNFHKLSFKSVIFN